MAQRSSGEDTQQESPNTHEEPEDKQNDHPRWCMSGAPEVSPVPSVRCGQEEVLDENGNEEPKHNLAAHYRFVETGNLAWRLTIVIREAKE